MKAKWATYFSHALLNGNKPSTVDEFRASLVPFARERLVYMTAVINSMLQCWKGDAPDLAAHTEIVKSTFPRAMAENLIAVSKSKEPHFVFHREQLLLVAREAVLHCPDDGLDPMKYLEDTGKMFLMANDHLYTPLHRPRVKQKCCSETWRT